MAFCRILAKSFPTPSRDLVHAWEARSSFPRWREARKGLPGGIAVGKSSPGLSLWAFSGDMRGVGDCLPHRASSPEQLGCLPPSHQCRTPRESSLWPYEGFPLPTWISRSKPQSMQTAKFQPLSHCWDLSKV